MLFVNFLFMKVLHITPYFYPIQAGAELYVYEVAKYLVKKNYEVSVLTKHFGNLTDFELIDGIKVYRVRSLDIPKLRSFIAFMPMLNKALRLEYDFIHAHITYPSAIIAYIINKIKKTPYIVTCQGDELLDYPESKELKYIKPILELALKNASKIHCISNAIKNSLINNFNISKSKIEVIPNGVDLKKFRPTAKINLKEKFNAEFILINVSRLSPKNNIEKTIEAFKLVSKKHKNIKYLIVGEGKEKKNLKKLIDKLNLGSDVILMGWIRHDELPAYIAGSDAFIRTSITEGLGIVFLEAMACGTPVIASRVHGILDIVEDYKTGLLVDPNDVNQIAKKIAEIIEDESLRERLSRNGINFVKNFEWAKICERSEKLYYYV